MGAKWAVFWIFMLLGVIILGSGVLLFVKSRAPDGGDGQQFREIKSDQEQLVGDGTDN